VLGKIAKILSIAVALTMVLGVFAVLIPRTTAETPNAPMFVEPERMDIGPQLRSQSAGAYAIKTDGMISSTLSSAGGLGMNHTIGDTAPFLVIDNWYGYYFFSNFRMRGNGTYCEVWVQIDLNFTAGDPRNDWNKLQINDTNVNYIINQFDNNIYPKEKQYFGVPAALDGSNSLLKEYGYPDNYIFETKTPGRVMIMIGNIRDENYYYPSYPYYIAGYFDPALKTYYDRNIITIDCWDWKNRTTGNVPRPYVYESTVAHEYQHLLRDAYKPGDATWTNEGSSMYAEFLCGYGIDWSYVNSYFYTPDNSLTEWGDQGDINILADYGAADLFMIYVNDHFGGASTISAIFHDKLYGADSITDALKNLGYSGWNFKNVYRAFSLANLIRSDNPGNGLYNYKSIDLSSANPNVTSVFARVYYPYYGEVARSDYGTTRTILGYDTYESLLNSYGTNYYFALTSQWYTGVDPLMLKYEFAGWNSAPSASWQLQPDGSWWSGNSNMRDVTLVGSADLTNVETATLTFDTYYSAEETYDFCFVQVSTNGGVNWTSLSNQYTTSVNNTDVQAIIANMPGLTGDSGGWMTMSYDLSNYVGQKIMFQFRYMTDEGTTWNGWYVSNVYVNAQTNKLIDNGRDVIGLKTVYPDADYMITVYAPSQYTAVGLYLPSLLFNVTANDVSDTAMKSFSSLTIYDYAIIVVSTTQGPVDYQFGIINT
jgi:hypothetical protein